MKSHWRICAVLLLSALLTVPLGCSNGGGNAPLSEVGSQQLPLQSGGLNVGSPEKTASATFVKFFEDSVGLSSAARWGIANSSGNKQWVLSNTSYSDPRAWVIGQNYWNGENDRLTSVGFSVPDPDGAGPDGTAGVILSFYSRWDIRSGDFGRVDYSTDNGTSWIQVQAFTNGSNVEYPEWNRYAYSLPSNFSGSDRTYRIRYRFTSDAADTGWGFGVDSISVYQRRLEVPVNAVASDLDGSIVGQVRVSWTADADVLQPDSYRITRATSEFGTYLFLATINDPDVTTSYLDTPPATLTPYWYKVEAQKVGWPNSAVSVANVGRAATTGLFDLGAAAPFGGVGGGAGMTNQGILTVINGDICTTGASTLITGFHDTDGDVYTETPLNMGSVNGQIYTAPPLPGTTAQLAVATQAVADAQSAYNRMSPGLLPGGTDPGAGQLGGLTFFPGVYKAAGGTFQITGANLTLDGQGNSNAVWVFQAASSLTVGDTAPRSITLINGAQAANVYWWVGSAATINAAGGGTMVGTIIASSGVTFSTAGNVVLTTLDGRALGLNASVTMVNTIINVPE